MPVPARRATRLGIFLTDFANNGYRQRRLQLDPAAIHDPVLTARLSGQQVMINGNALYPPSPSPLRLLPARNRSLVGAPAAGRGRTTWTARMSAISWIFLLAVAKTVRWPSQKVTGLPGSLRHHSAPNI